MQFYRNYDEGLKTAVEEFVQIVKQSKTRGQLSHLNVRENTGAPQGAWGRAVDTLMQSREKGLELQTDCVGYKKGIGGHPGRVGRLRGIGRRHPHCRGY